MRARKILESARLAAGICVVGLGPMVGRSPSWGQQVLDGSTMLTPAMAGELDDALKLGGDLVVQVRRERLQRALLREGLVSGPVSDQALDSLLDLLGR